MEKYYFQSSLDLLINDLEQYENTDKVIEFIKNFDLLLELEDDIFIYGKPTEQQVKYFQQIINKIWDFMVGCLDKKVNLGSSIEIGSTNLLNELHINVTIPVKSEDCDTEKKYNIITFNSL